jgi:microcystin-dependent protein
MEEMLWIEGMEGRLEMRRMKKLMVAGAMVLALAVAAWGEDVGGIVPGTMNFQARLARVSEGAATPLTGIQHVAFRLYDAAEGGTLVWAREFPVTCTSDGTFNLVLDDGGSKLGTPAEEKLCDSFQGTARYFELEVEGIGTLQPRMRVPTAPYAFQAQYTLRGGDGGFEVGGTLSVADDADLRGAVTAGTGKVDSLTVTSGGATAGSMSVTGKVTVPAGKPNEAKGVVPVGGILAWTRADIPTGWAICDGNIVEGVQTPDLRGLFVMGAGDGHDVNSTGGAASVKLTTDQIPSHSHGYVYPSGDGQGTWFLVQNHDGHIWRYYTDATTGEAGGDEPHENRPPFFAVYYIMRVK